ncbi:MAG TPA: hypothetical protein VJ600_03530 [Holophagaceae bacterium]|nr:hypothetical protein [Holophagaceae bacterium]
MAWTDSTDLLAPLAPWFEAARRGLPWRAEDLDRPHPDPYAVLVSELMLQQTQVATVVPYFERWMARFPTAAALAGAGEDEVHKAWEGLGYYRRCRFLKAASAVVAERGWPSDLEGLAGLPGLGPYTAAAVGSIAFQWPTPALDGNAFRVLARLLLIEGDPKAQAADLRTWLSPALDAHGPSRMTQAIMELGATVCLPAPKCGACPLSAGCGARQAGRTSDIPPVAKRARPQERDLILLAVEAEGHFLLHPPAEKGLLAGLWRWPTAAPGEGAAEEPAPYSEVEARSWEGWTQVYTHRRERVEPLHLKLPARFHAAEGLRWIQASELAGLPLGRRDDRLRDLLKGEGQAPLSLPLGLLSALR